MINASVIVPTYNGAHKVINALTALAQQDRQDFEVIVSIDGSTDNTAQIIAQARLSVPNLKVLDNPNGGRSIARNRGVRASVGKFLLFLDDDMRPNPAWVGKHIANLEQNPNSIWVGGISEAHLSNENPVQRWKADLVVVWEKNLPAYPQTMKREGLFVAAANLALSAELFNRLGGFDERLTDAEDFDLGVRALQEGINIYYDGSNTALHDDFITAKSYIKRLRQYSNAHQKLRDLNPDLYPPSSLPTLPAWKRWVYSFFARHFWLNSLQAKRGWLHSLPASLRYRLYDYIITGYASHYKDRVIEP